MYMIYAPHVGSGFHAQKTGALYKTSTEQSWLKVYASNDFCYVIYTAICNL